MKNHQAGCSPTAVLAGRPFASDCRATKNAVAMRRRFLVGVVTALSLTVVCVLPVSAQEGGIDFVVEPAPGSDTAPGGGYFLVGSNPGDTVAQSLALRNDSRRRLSLKLDAVDATTGPFGGVSYGVESESPSRAGTWLALSKNSVTLAPGESAIVDFKITVPRNAASGEHLAGISVWSPAPEADTTEAQQAQAGAAIHVQTRRIVAVQVRLSGPSQPELVISGVDAAARPDGLYLEIGIDNAGRGLTKAHGLIEIPSEDFQQNFDIDTFVPGTTIAYPVRWTDSVPEGGYGARVEIEYEGGVAHWEGTFTVGKGVLEELAERGAGPPQEAQMWWPLAVGAALVVGLALIVLFGRRRVRITKAPQRDRSPIPDVRQPGRAQQMPAARVPRRAPPPPPPPTGAVPPPPPPRLGDEEDSRDELRPRQE